MSKKTHVNLRSAWGDMDKAPQLLSGEAGVQTQGPILPLLLYTTQPPDGHS